MLRLQIASVSRSSYESTEATNYADIDLDNASTSVLWSA